MLSQQVVFSDDDDDEASKKTLDYSFLKNMCQHFSVLSPKKEMEEYHNDNNENVIVSPLGNEDHLSNLPTTNRSKLNILGNPFTSPKKNVYDLSQLASPTHETKDVRLEVLFRELSPTGSEVDLKLISEQKQKVRKGVLSPKVRNGSLTSTSKSSCRSPLSALEIRQLKLREILRSEDPDPEWCPDKKSRLCLISRLEEVKECEECDDNCVDQVDTPTRNLRPRKKQEFDSDDELPLQELRDRLITQKTDDDDLSLRLEPLSDDDDPIVSYRRQSYSSRNQPEESAVTYYKGRKVLNVRLPIDNLMCRIEDKMELSLGEYALLRSNSLKFSQPPVLNSSQESIKIPSEFDISSADSDWGRNRNFSTPKSSARKLSKRKATNSLSPSKRRVCIIESDSDHDDDVLLAWKSGKVPSTSGKTSRVYEDSTSRTTPKQKTNHCGVVTPLRKRLKREQNAYHSDSDDDMPLISVARMCQTERACRKRDHKRRPSH